METLHDIYKKYMSYCDKGDRSSINMYGHNYIDIYHECFNMIRFDVKNFLEIGVMSGASTLMWHDYFPNATIYALDRQRPDDNTNWPKFFPDVNYEFVEKIDRSDRIKLFIGDAYSDSVFLKIKREKIKFDVMIDDGFHSLDTQSYFIKNYLKLLNSNGIFCIEDIGMDPIYGKNQLSKVINTFPENLKNNISAYDWDVSKPSLVKRAPGVPPHDKLVVLNLRCQK